MSPNLYRQKQKTQNIVYGPAVSTTVQHWVLAEANCASSLEEPERASQIPFTCKTWQKTETHTPKELGDGSVLEYQTVSPVKPLVAEAEPDALTASDIRGAVGGETIPGIASEAPKEETKEEPKEEIKSPERDAEGDVVMEQ